VSALLNGKSSLVVMVSLFEEMACAGCVQGALLSLLFASLPN
jgi:hypothetical protein